VSTILTFRQGLKRGTWSLSYTPTLRYFWDASSQSQFDHRAAFETNLLLSKRWGFEFHAGFLKSTNPFLRVEPIGGGETTPGDVLFGPNQSFVGPDRRYTSVQSGLTFTYALSGHSGLSMGADYYGERQQVTELLTQQVGNLRAQYSSQYARNKSWGTMYSLQHFRASAANQRINTHSLILFHSYDFTPSTQLSVFGGPQYSYLRAEPTVAVNFGFFTVEIGLRVAEPVLNFALGALFTQRLNEQTWMDVSVSQRVSEGGGFTGTTLQRSARLDFRRQWTRRWSTSLAGYATDNRSLGGFVSRNARTYGLSAGFGCRLSKRMGLRAAYDFSLFSSGPQELEELLSRNRFSVGIHYALGTFPLGR
jgi:opacity protein-like surface antigen